MSYDYAVNKMPPEKRQKYIIHIGAFCVFILVLCSAGPALALRCGTELVSLRDRKIEVLNKCGEPEFIEHWETETVTYIAGIDEEIRGNFLIDRQTRHTRSSVVTYEEWTYNFGPRKFLRYLTFVNGKLGKIEEGPKGFSGEILGGHHRERCGHLVDEGDRKVEVIMKCGDPYGIEFLWEEQFSGLSSKERIRRIPKFYRDGRGPVRKEFEYVIEKIYEQRRSLVNVEEWTYNFGPRRFLRFIRFENGRVVNVEEGDYGF